MPSRAAKLHSVKNIVILISGRGSNMEAIVKACAAEQWPARIVAVISNRPDAAGLQFAQTHGIATQVVDHKTFADRAAFDAALQNTIDRYEPYLVLLAGFMRVLGAGVVRHYAGRMLNIHPSLLPSFPGLNTHERALQTGVKLHGATVHFVTEQLDSGGIVVQSAVPVLPGDDTHTLAERVLRTEHVIYPRAVRWFVQGLLELRDGKVTVKNGCNDEPQWLVAKV
jgi:phosphoribosylglycinamide formyltransferase-1